MDIHKNARTTSHNRMLMVHRLAQGDRTGQSNRRAGGRGLGWEFLHVAIDDNSRLAYTELLPNERKESAIAFTGRAVDWFAKHGVTVERIMSDNGSAYRSRAFADLLAGRGIKHRRTRPDTPRTNGKAERFIQTNLREWAYARAFQTSAERAAAMLPWITDYNTNRPHSALGGKPPMSRPTPDRAQAPTEPPDTSDTKPCFVGVDGVKPREATAKGGSGLTPAMPTQAQSATGWDNVLGNDTRVWPRPLHLTRPVPRNLQRARYPPRRGKQHAHTLASLACPLLLVGVVAPPEIQLPYPFRLQQMPHHQASQHGARRQHLVRFIVRQFLYARPGVMQQPELGCDRHAIQMQQAQTQAARLCRRPHQRGVERGERLGFFPARRVNARVIGQAGLEFVRSVNHTEGGAGHQPLAAPGQRRA